MRAVFCLGGNREISLASPVLNMQLGLRRNIGSHESGMVLGAADGSQTGLNYIERSWSSFSKKCL